MVTGNLKMCRDIGNVAVHVTVAAHDGGRPRQVVCA